MSVTSGFSDRERVSKTSSGSAHQLTPMVTTCGSELLGDGCAKTMTTYDGCKQSGATCLWSGLDTKKARTCPQNWPPRDSLTFLFLMAHRQDADLYWRFWPTGCQR